MGKAVLLHTRLSTSPSSPSEPSHLTIHSSSDFPLSLCTQVISLPSCTAKVFAALCSATQPRRPSRPPGRSSARSRHSFDTLDGPTLKRRPLRNIVRSKYLTRFSTVSNRSTLLLPDRHALSSSASAITMQEKLASHLRSDVHEQRRQIAKTDLKRTNEEGSGLPGEKRI